MDRHLKALLIKNWILWKRNKCQSCMEICIPIIVTLFLVMFRTSVKVDIVEEKSYLDQIKVLWPDKDSFISSYKLNPKQKVMKECDASMHVALAAPANVFNQISLYFTSIQYQVKLYQEESDILSYIKSSDYGNDLCFGIFIDQYDVSTLNFKYRLYFNSSVYDETPDVPSTLGSNYSQFTEEMNDEQFTPWFESGFLQIQNWIDREIFKSLVSSDKTPQIKVSMASQKSKSYKKDTFLKIMENQSNTFFVLPYIYVFLKMTQRLLTEKEKRIREGMKVMGMKDSSFYKSWIIQYAIIYFISCFIQTILLAGSVLKNSNFLLILIWLYFYCISLIFQSIFITTFFSSAQMGNIFGMIFYLVMYILVNFFNQDGVSAGTKVFSCFFSQTGMSFGSSVFMQRESDGVGVGFGNIGDLVSGVSFGLVLMMCLLNIFTFGTLAYYLDQVFPNDFGQKRHPLFFLDFCMSKELTKQKTFNRKNINADNSPNYEPVDSYLRDQEKRQTVLRIKGLEKVYPDGKYALKGISLTMYSGQIFVLLGHNGAGKTTTISMLTGMQEISGGWASVYGKDVADQMKDIRKFMGFCPQYDILFDQLTVREHLNLFAIFKGMKDPSDISKAVDQAISDVDLMEKSDEFSMNLSGGQKRKLSVAMAFIGDSKLIFLDEPTSGMDTSARRHIWEMLKKYKTNKIVILTTHFMDEADFLGDRIAIMNDGRVQCCGSSMFLKNKFGVGYNLVITKQQTFGSNKSILEMVQHHVPPFKLISNVSAELSMQLPLEFLPQFESLFNEIDSRKLELGIQTYAISITTLEEVFLRITSKYNFSKNENENEGEQKNDGFSISQQKVRDSMLLSFMQLKVMVKKRLLYFKRDKKSCVCEICLPIFIILAGLFIAQIKFVVEQGPVIISDPNSSYLNTPEKIESGYLTDSSLDYLTKMSPYMPKQMSFEIQKQNTVQSLYDFIFTEMYNMYIGSVFINDMNNQTLKFDNLNLINTNHKYGPPLFLNTINQAIISEILQKQVNIEVTLTPFPFTKKEQQRSQEVGGMLGSFIFSLGLSFIPASIIQYIVREKELKIKHQQLVSGLSIFIYWFSNLFVDIMKHFIPSIFSILLIVAFQITSLTEKDGTAAMALLIILFGWAAIPFSYVLSFLFDNSESAQVQTFFFSFITGSMLPLITLILTIIESTRGLGNFFSFILRVFFPTFAFGEAVSKIGSKQIIQVINNTTEEYTAFSAEISGTNILLLLAQGIIYTALIFILERSQNGRCGNCFSKEYQYPYEPQKYDDDVTAEMRKVERTNPSKFNVCVKNLRKVFAPSEERVKIAVDRISIGVENGECFTLLGVNGAGKTTTFKILGGEIQPTDGDVHIMGVNLSQDLNRARQYIGYCPQFDALLPLLTAREHLEIYSCIKGIPNDLQDRLISQKITELDLSYFSDVQAGTYSGGNKRKLSTAIAMLGNPPIILLDEPSTGMDPAARRFMWSVISNASTKRKKTSVILTTHSMEEAEALSSRMAIQVDGELKCIGSVQHIKFKFGIGYEVEIKFVNILQTQIRQIMSKCKFQYGKKVNDKNLDRYLSKLEATYLVKKISNKGSGSSLYQQIMSSKGLDVQSLIEFKLTEDLGDKVITYFQENNFDKIEVIEHFQSFFRFRIQANSSIGKIFGIFEKNKAEFSIAQYSVKQASIEQIFNAFAEGRSRINPEYRKQHQQGQTAPIVQMNTIHESVQQRDNKSQQANQSQINQIPPAQQIELKNNAQDNSIIIKSSQNMVESQNKNMGIQQKSNSLKKRPSDKRSTASGSTIGSKGTKIRL